MPKKQTKQEGRPKPTPPKDAVKKAPKLGK